MAARLVASTSCLRCALAPLPASTAIRSAGTLTARLKVFNQGKPTRKTALASVSRARRRRTSLGDTGLANPSYLHQLVAAPGGWTQRHRIGRGIGSGRGKGRRGKGAGQDRNKTRRDFNGGASTILSQKIPKRIHIPKEPGFTPYELHVDRLAYYIRQGRIDPERPITLKELYDSGCAPSKKGGVRLYGTPSPAAFDPHRRFPAVSIIVNKASPKAIRTIEEAGGSVVARYYNPMAVRAVTRPDAYLHRGRVIPRVSNPTSKRDLDFYSDPANRGYIWLRAIEGVERNRARRPRGGRAEETDTVDAARAPGPSGLENPPERRAEEA